MTVEARRDLRGALGVEVGVGSCQLNWKLQGVEEEQGGGFCKQAGGLQQEMTEE